MEKQKITWVGERKPIQTKYGDREKFSIKTDRHGDKFISVWVNGVSGKWKIGDEIEVEVKEREYNGKKYYDAELPKQAPNSGQMTEVITRLGQIAFTVDKVDSRVNKIFRHLSGVERLDQTSDGSDMPRF